MKKQAFYDRFLKLATVFVPVLAFLLGVWKFNHEQNEISIAERQSTIWHKQLEAYEALGISISKVTESKYPSEEFNLAVSEFRHLYTGKRFILFDPAVKIELHKFNEAIKDLLQSEWNTDKTALNKLGDAFVECREKWIEDYLKRHDIRVMKSIIKVSDSLKALHLETSD